MPGEALPGLAGVEPHGRITLSIRSALVKHVGPLSNSAQRTQPQLSDKQREDERTCKIGSVR